MIQYLGMSQLNPDEFIITRKRKKYKFAKFNNAKNCFEFDQWQKQPADIVELGAGTGLFALELAKRNPDRRVVAIDVKADRLQHGAYLALELGVYNISFIRARADQLSELFEAGSVSDIWLTFSDPFPRKGSAGRRMTHPNYLRIYKQILTPSGSLLVKHDNRDFFCWTLEQLVAEWWRINELTFDLHESSLSDNYKILTTYEQRWLGEGLTTNFTRATYPSSSN